MIITSLILYLCVTLTTAFSTIAPTSIHLEGVLSGSFASYSNITIIAFQNNFIVPYGYTFQNTPIVLLSLVDYKDSSTQQIVLFGIFVQTVTTTQMIYSFFYTTHIAQYPVRFRSRYIIWDPFSYIHFTYFIRPVVCPDHQTLIQQNIPLPHSVNTTTTYPQCFIQLVYNFKITTTDQLAVQCQVQTIDSNSLNLFIGTLNGEAYYPTTLRYAYVVILIVEQTAIISVQHGQLKSQSPTPAVLSLTIPPTNCAYIIGIYSFASITRNFNVRLLHYYGQIDHTANYHSVYYNYMLINFDITSQQVYVYKTVTHFENNYIILYYRNVINPSLVTKEQFNIAGSSSFLAVTVEFVELSASPSKGEIAVTFSYLQSDIGLTPEVTFRCKVFGVEFTAKTVIYLTLIRELLIELDSTSIALSIVNVIGTTNFGSYTANYSFYQNLLHNYYMPGTTVFNLSLDNNAYDERVSINITYMGEDYSSNVSFTLVKLESVQAVIRTNQSKVRFTGFRNPTSLLSSHFSIITDNTNTITVDFLQIDSQNVTIVFSDGIQNLLSQLIIKYTVPIVLNNIMWFNIHSNMIEMIQWKQTDVKNHLNITITNPHNVSVLKSQFEILSPSYISIVSIDASNNIVHLFVTFTQNIKNQKVSIKHQHPSLSYSNILTFQLNPNQIIYYWSESSMSNYSYQSKIGQAIQYIYLSVFVFSLICNKLLGVETIFMLHLAFYSYIPIGIQKSVSLFQWGLLKYVGGYNPLFDDNQNILLANYSALNIKCRFQTNFNLMIVFLLIYPIIFLCLYLIARKSFHYKTKPRLLKYSMAFLLEFPLATLLFYSFNIFISFIVNLECNGTTSQLSLFFSIFMIILLQSTIILFIVFQNRFTQFNKQISQVDMIFKIDIEKSTRIRKMYPLVISIEMTCIPILLSLKKLFDISLYLVLGVNILATIFILFATPYVRKSDNLRLLSNRVIVISITATQLMTYIKVSKDILNNLVLFQSWIIYSLLTVGVMMNACFIIIKTIDWFKKPGIIDMRLYVQQKGTSKKGNEIDFVYLGDGASYPRLEYGVGRKNLIERQRGRFNKSLRKELLLKNLIAEN